MWKYIYTFAHDKNRTFLSHTNLLNVAHASTHHVLSRRGVCVCFYSPVQATFPLSQDIRPNIINQTLGLGLRHGY